MKHWFSDLPAFRRDPLTFLEERGCNAETPLVRLHLGPRPVFLIADPILVKPIMKSAETQLDKGRLIHKLRKIVGRSSLTTSGNRQRQRRAAIHQQIARGLATSFVPQLSAIIREFASRSALRDSFDVHELTAQLALRIISSILFGHHVLAPADENALIEAVKLVEDDLAEGMFRLLPPSPRRYWSNRRRLKAAREIMSAVVQKTANRASSSSLVRSLLELDLTDEELEDEVLMLLLAGHHTTGTAAAWLLYHIAVEPGLAAQLAREAQTITDEVGEVNADLLPHAQTSLSAVRETLRLYPSAWWYSREVMQKVEIAGFTLKPGTSLIMSPWQYGREPRFWAQPEHFDIARAHQSNRAFLPFGVGPRACVGMGMALLEMQLIALEFASAYDLRVLSAVPAQRPKPSVTLVPFEIRMAADVRSPLDTTQAIRSPSPIRLRHQSKGTVRCPIPM